MKSILIICQHFIPYTPSLGRVIRMVSLADYLKKEGFRVFILTSKGINFSNFGYDKLLDDLTVVYADDPVKRRVQKKQLEKFAGDRGRRDSAFKLFLGKIVKSLVENIAIPDLGIFMVGKYFQIASEIIEKEKITNVLVSSPPHSMQMVGAKLKKRFGEKIFLTVEYRDSWNTSRAFAKNFFLSRIISEMMERAVLRSCDNFVFVSQPMLEKLHKKFSLDLSARAHLIMNGFIKEQDVESPSTMGDTRRIIRIGYFGQASDRRNDPHSIRNLLNVLRRKPREFKDLVFEFYGAIEMGTPDASIPIRIHGSIPHESALRKMAEMDYLLFLYADPASSDEVISGKLFEYISVRKPILCVGPHDMEARRIVEKYGIGITVDIENPADIEKKLASLPELLDKDFYGDFDISLFKREKQYGTFLKLLH